MPPQVTQLTDGTSVRIHGASDYAAIAEVVGTIPSTLKGQRGEPTTGLKVRVLEALTAQVVPGSELELYAFWVGGSACELKWGASLTTENYPLGSRVRISTDKLAFPIWERRYRLLVQK